MKFKIALSSLLLGVFSFVHILGAEKAGMAILFGIWAIKESPDKPGNRKIAWIGIILGALYLITLTGIITFYPDKVLSIFKKTGQ